MVKGLLLPVLLLKPGVQDKEDMFDYSFGFSDPKLDKAWNRLKGPDATALNEPLSHTSTNLIVEWVRLNAQRGSKGLCALAAPVFVLGILVGALVF